MIPPDRQTDRLLADLFHEEWESGALARATRRAARAARRRRLVARGARALGGVIAVAAVIVALTRFPWRDGSHDMERRPFTAADSERPPLEIISDAELVALLRHESVLIVRDRGRVDEVIWLENRRLDAGIE